MVLWDTRTLTPAWTNHKSPGVAANRCAFDPSGNVLAVAREDGAISLLETATGIEGNEACRLYDCS